MDNIINSIVQYEDKNSIIETFNSKENNKSKDRMYLINRVLPSKYNIDGLNTYGCGPMPIIEELPSQYNSLCTWKENKDYIYTNLLYKDIKNSDISIITINISFCNELDNIKESSVIFNYNNLEKKVILDSGDKAFLLIKLNKFLDLTIPYQAQWAKEYKSSLNDLQKDFIYYDREKNLFIIKDEINKDSNHKILNIKDFTNKIPNNNSLSCPKENTIMYDKNNNKFFIKNVPNIENFIDSNNMASDDDNCSWCPHAECLPKDFNYELPKEYSEKKYPVPQCCKKFGLNNQTANIISKKGGSNDYVYIDGRKMLIDKADMEQCYTASYWVDPEIRDNCDTDYEDKTNISNLKKIEIDENCFREIPSDSGFNTSKNIPFNELSEEKVVKALDCNKAIKPSQRSDAADLVTQEANYWTNKSKKNKMLYNTKSALASSKYNEISKIGGQINNHMGQYNQNNNQIKQLKANIASKQRQIEISNDETYRVNERIYFLKLLLLYFILISIPLILSLFFKDIFKGFVLLAIILIITIPMFIIVIRQLYNIRNRHPERWPLRQWRQGIQPNKNDEYPKTDTQKNIHQEEEYYEESERIETIEDTEDTKIITKDEKEYKCKPIKQEEDVSDIEQEIQELNNKIQSCKQRRDNWKNNKEILRNKICKKKKLNPSKCNSLKLE